MLEYFTAASGSYEFSHKSVNQGGIKYPTKDTLHAHDPQTGEHAGQLEYYPPKRKGSPVHVIGFGMLDFDRKRGVGSALLNEMEARHPGSRVVWMDKLHEKNKPKPGDPNFNPNRDYGLPTDWDTHYPKLPGSIHRGIGISLEPHEARQVNNAGVSKEEQAQTLYRHVRNQGPIGMHWSADPNKPHQFAFRNALDPRTDIPVVLHAQTPERKEIEVRPDVLRSKGVWPHDHISGDAEVPIRKRRPVKVTGISWLPDVEHPDADEYGWVHHTFDEPQQHIASVEGLFPEKVGSTVKTEIEEYFGGGDGRDQGLLRVAGRGRPRRDQSGSRQPSAPQRGAGDGGAPSGQQQGDPDPAGGRAEGPRPVEFHPQAHKDLKALDKPIQKQIMGVIDALANDDPVALSQTHALTMALKGWNATKASRGHRIVHRPSGDGGGIHVGYVGLHEYDKAIRRLTKRSEGDLYYRLHPKEAPFGPEHAYSPPIGAVGEVARGYSSFSDPHHLHDYMHAMEWVGHPEVDWDDRHVIQFRGDRVGTGIDGEDLVVPHSDRPEKTMDWSEFEKSLEPSSGSRWTVDKALRPRQSLRRLTTLNREPGPVTFPYLRNTEGAPNLGSMYAQDVEPHGRYVNYHAGPKPEGDRWETGELTFKNPLHLDYGGNSTEPTHWKHQLSEQYGGKKGKALSRALAKDGYDGIITHDEYGPSEIVDLTGFHRQAAKSDVCPCGLSVVLDPVDGWQHADGSVSHDGEHYGKSTSDLMESKRRKEAAKQDVMYVGPYHGSFHYDDLGDFRRVLYTSPKSQLVVMHLRPGEDIGEEVHDVDQTIMLLEGRGVVTLNGNTQAFGGEDVVCIPAGVKHNIVNGKDGPMRLATVYAPAHHAPGTVHHTKADAKADKGEEFKPVKTAATDDCSCCGGAGEHITGHECYRCDSSGKPDADERRQPWCDEVFRDLAAHAERCPHCGPQKVAKRRPKLKVSERGQLSREAMKQSPGKGPLPIEPEKTWYRLHYRPRSWGDATSAEITPYSGSTKREEYTRAPGFSAMGDPHDLDRYLDEMGWYSHIDKIDPEHKNHTIVQFPGERTGRTGSNGEPLVKPGPRADRIEMPIEEFHRRLDETPYGDEPGSYNQQVTQPRKDMIEHLQARHPETQSFDDAHFHGRLTPWSIHDLLHEHTDVEHSHEGLAMSDPFAYWLKGRKKTSKRRPKLKSRIFGPSKGSLDPALFEGTHLRPEVRTAVLSRLGAVLEPILGKDWERFTKVYLAGSQASEWWGNHDFDTLIGIDFDHLGGEPGIPVAGLEEDHITDMLNSALRASYNAEPWEAPFGGSWSLTGYVNANSYDIRKIKPYAAYNISDNAWAVRPPHLLDWSVEKFPAGKGMLDEAKGYADIIEAIDKMPEPFRTQQGQALWEHLHGDRSRAFSERGEGWVDPGNAIEKALVEWGLWDKLVAIKFGPQKTASKEPDDQQALEDEFKENWETSSHVSKHLTGASAHVMGIPGYEHAPGEVDWLGSPEHREDLASAALRAIKRHPGSPEPLYHGGNSSRFAKAEPGEHIDVPLKATSGAYSVAHSFAGYGKGVIMHFPKGTPHFEQPGLDAENWADPDDRYSVGEGVVAGRFKVKEKAVDDLGHTHLKLEHVAHFDPDTKQWMPSRMQKKATKGEYCETCDTHHDYQFEEDDHYRSYTDWDKAYPRVGPEIHRGMAVQLSPDAHAKVHSDAPEHERAQALLREVTADGAGMHWTDSGPEMASRIADEEADRQHSLVHSSTTHVVLHADKPRREDVEDDIRRLVNESVISRHAGNPESEVPLKQGASVNVWGVSWRHHNEPGWHFHEFDHPITKKASWEHREISSLHRGMGVDLPEELHAYVHDASVPKRQRAERLLEHVGSEPFGMHWTDDPDVARDFSSRAARKEHLDESDEHSTPVVVHAEGPELEHIETDRDALRKKRVRSYDDEKDAESEVPLKAGAPVNVVAISWADPSSYRNGRHKFQRAYLDEPVRKRAGVRGDHPLAPDLPQEQHDALTAEPMSVYRRKLLELAKNPVPGTHMWRGEVRKGDPIQGVRETGVGIHWGLNPDTIVRPPAVGDDEHEVVYHAELEHPGEQNFDRSHPMWGGSHRSLDSEAEVRLKPGSKVKLHGVWVRDPHHPDPGYFVPRVPERMGGQWSYHPIGEHVPVAHRPSSDVIDYTDVGVRHEGMLEYFTASDDDTSYRMQHRPPGPDGIPIHNLDKEDYGMPSDVYTHPHYYDPTGGDPHDSSYLDARSVFQRVRGKPEANVRIYRSLPAEHAHQGFRAGDWITTSKDYARQHGKHNDDPKHDWPVISAVVKAKHLHTAADDLREYGYNGPDITHHSVAFKGGYHQEVREHSDGTIRPVQHQKQDKTADRWGSHVLKLSPEDYAKATDIGNVHSGEAAKHILKHLPADITWHPHNEDPQDARIQAELKTEQMLRAHHPEGEQDPGTAPLLGVTVNTRRGKTINHVSIKPHVKYKDLPNGFWNEHTPLMMKATPHPSLKAQGSFENYFGAAA